uniref:Calcium uniporter protein n=1 Tax=Haemonchus contortus TaxID=6289 RepID=A0A7I4YJA4_HAECO
MLIRALLRRISLLSSRTNCLPNFYRVSFFVLDVPLRRCSSQTKDQGAKSGQGNQSKFSDPQDKVKVRKAYILGGCLMFMWISLHGILLYRRRNEHRSLNEKLPPISWEEFVNKYLLSNKVKTIVFQPQFEVGNVYLHSPLEASMKKAMLDLIHIAPDKFSRPPDVRFYFEGDGPDVEKAILELQKATHGSATPLKAVEFELDQFPSYRELAFIIISTLFTVVAVAVVK